MLLSIKKHKFKFSSKIKKGYNISYQSTLLLLKEFLKELRETQEKFHENSTIEKKQSISINFQESIFKILDYSYTNLPTDRKKLSRYCPRPSLMYTEKQFINKNKSFTHNKQNIKIPKKAILFLKHLYRVNKEYNYAISYIKGKVKHETPNKFGEKAKIKLKADIVTNHDNPLKINDDGSIQISDFIKAEAGATLNFHGVTVSTPQGTSYIKKLEYSGSPFEGDKIILDKDTKIKFNDWANDCMKICEEVIEQYKGYE